jgi:hypothetical protein
MSETGGACPHIFPSYACPIEEKYVLLCTFRVLSHGGNCCVFGGLLLLLLIRQLTENLVLVRPSMANILATKVISTRLIYTTTEGKNDVRQSASLEKRIIELTFYHMYVDIIVKAVDVVVCIEARRAPMVAEKLADM